MAFGKDHPYHWIENSISRPGRIREATHTPAGKDVPEKKIDKLEHSKDKSLAAAAREAETLKHMHTK